MSTRIFMSLGRLFQRFAAAEVTQDLPMWNCQNSKVDIWVTIVTALFLRFYFRIVIPPEWAGKA